MNQKNYAVTDSTTFFIPKEELMEMLGLDEEWHLVHSTTASMEEGDTGVFETGITVRFETYLR